MRDQQQEWEAWQTLRLICADPKIATVTAYKLAVIARALRPPRELLREVGLVDGVLTLVLSTEDLVVGVEFHYGHVWEYVHAEYLDSGTVPECLRKAHESGQAYCVIVQYFYKYQYCSRRVVISDSTVKIGGEQWEWVVVAEPGGDW